MTTPAPAAAPPENPGPRAPRSAVLLFAVLGLTAAAYANALHGPFLWDDRILIVDAPSVHRISVAPFGDAFWNANTTQAGDASYYRPLVKLSYAVDWVRGGGRPAPFHVTNVLLHLIVTALVFALARRMGAGAVGAGLGALAFGVYPRLTESVTWISGRTDTLAMAFALGAVLLFVPGPGGLLRRGGAALLLLLGLLCKEVAAVALVWILVAEALTAARRERPWGRVGLDVLPLLAALVPYAILRWGALHHLPRASYSVLRNGPGLPFRALARYAWMLLDPRPATLIGHATAREPALVAAGVVVALALVAGGILALRARIRPELAGAAAAAVGALALVLHVVSLPISYVAADRFLYVPLACLGALLPAALTHASIPWRRGVGIVAAAAIVPWGVLATRRNEDYSSEVGFWRKVAEADWTCSAAWNELGGALARAGLYEDALPVYQHALQYASDAEQPYVLANVATGLSDVGRLDEAEQIIQAVIAKNPRLPINYFNLAIFQVRLLRLDDAERTLQKALELYPSYADARQALQFLGVARKEIAGLPPERPDEPAAVRASRARLWMQLNLQARAVALWLDVLRAPDAVPADLRQGAAYVVTFGERAAADLALDRLGTTHPDAKTIESLAAVYADRFGSSPVSATFSP